MNKSLYFYLINFIFSLNLNCSDSSGISYSILSDRELKTKIEPRDPNTGLTTNNIYFRSAKPGFNIAIYKRLNNTLITINENTEFTVFLDLISISCEAVEFLSSHKIETHEFIQLKFLYNFEQNRFYKDGETITWNHAEFVISTRLEFDEIFLEGKKRCIAIYAQHQNNEKSCSSCTIL